jgi:hypothetical protein
MRRIAALAVLAIAVSLHSMVASAQETAPAATPAPASAAAGAPQTVVVLPQPAQPLPGGVVQTQHLGAVVVAETGSRVSVHNEATVYLPPAEPPPDPGRRTAIIASSLVFGIGLPILGGGYLAQHGSQSCTYDPTNGARCSRRDATDWLVTYDLDMAVVPSIPRWVVGDVTGAVVFTALRGASVALASAVAWGDDAYGPVVLGFFVPLTLGIVDLATTPHRKLAPAEQDTARTASAAPGLTLTSFGPAPLTGADHRLNGGTLQMAASF